MMARGKRKVCHPPQFARRHESFLQNVDFAVTSSLAVASSLFEKALERMKFLPGSL